MDMMTDQRRMIRETARDFARREILPVAKKLDPIEGDIPMELREKIAELGFFGIIVPEEYGGMGLGSYEHCMVTEEFARAWMSVGSIIAHGSAMACSVGLNDEQKQYYLPRIARGELIGAGSFSEPGVGSDLASLQCRAEKDGDSWVITGNKYWCTFADGADFIILLARTSKDPDPTKKHRGISAFLIDKERGKLPEGCSGNPIPKIGYFGWKTWELSFDGTRVPAHKMIGEPGEGFYRILHGMERLRAQTAARAIGVARGALEDATEYMHERKQFGHPLADFQALRFKLAEMAVNLEAARQLVYSVCEKIDANVRADLESSMAKYFASEMAERVTSEALQIHGGAGYTKLHSVERYWRDARLTKIFEGTSEIQLRVISDHLLGKSAS
ncbi:acyl-CoA dehydrogenase family protein [Afifella sp. IM 167]|uniref:acyl-CoA dehydrogenase family protein n=1 Tax=Afifella sp. IM 167 TaxID=2033586 RepID=UPI001CCD1E3A|nr:acyl-CoA dehydrogenase family protein [Afifella sp. IM 167]MBZ8134800.1 acyl-CoA dehydrogenase [Afifella sp. IM 167]